MKTPTFLSGNPTPEIFEQLARATLLAYTFGIPFLYDPSVLDSAITLRSTATHAVAAWTTTLVLAAAMARGRIAVRFTLVGWAALGFLACAAASLVGSMNPAAGTEPLKGITAAVCLGFVAARVWDQAFSRALLWAFVLPNAFLFVLGAVQYAASGLASSSVAPQVVSTVLASYFEQAVAPGTTFMNKNLTASWVGLTAPMAAGLVALTRGRTARVGAVVLLILSLWLLLLCRTRATWLALALTAAVSFALLPRPASGWLPTRPWLLPLGVIGIILAFATLGLPALEFERNFSLGWADLEARLAYNLNTLVMVRDHWINGVGIGAFFNAFPLYHDAWMATPRHAYDVFSRPAHTHDDVLQAFAETGVVGGLCFLGIFAGAFFYVAAVGRRPGRWKDPSFPFLALSLFTLFINALLDFPLQIPAAQSAAALIVAGIANEYLAGVAPRPRDRFVLASGAARPLTAVLGFTVLLAAGWTLADDLELRSAHVLLRKAWARVTEGHLDVETVELLDKASEQHPHDARIETYFGLIAGNYAGREPLPSRFKTAALERALAVDPWGPHALLALAEDQLVIAASEQSSTAEAATALQKAEALYGKLRRTADFSASTKVIGATVALLRGDLCEGEKQVREALIMEPKSVSAAELESTMARLREVGGREIADCSGPK